MPELPSRQLSVKTSNPKRRKVTYAKSSATGHDRHYEIFATDEPDSAPSSPQHIQHSHSNSLSSTSPSTPRYVPLHLHDEVFEAQRVGQQSSQRPGPGGLLVPSTHHSLTGVSATQALDTERDMTIVNNGEASYLNRGTEQTDHDIAPASPSEVSHLHLARPASPAKRTRSQRDGDDEGLEGNDLSIDRATKALQSPKRPSGLSQHVSPMPNRTKPLPKEVEMNIQSGSNVSRTNAGIAGDGSNDSNSGTSAVDSHSGSNNEPPAASSPPTSMDTDDDVPTNNQSPPRPASFDEQYQMVKKLIDETEQKEGLPGYLISMKWLERVIARTSLGSDHAMKGVKDALVGPIDNRDLLVDGTSCYKANDL